MIPHRRQLNKVFVRPLAAAVLAAFVVTSINCHCEEPGFLRLSLRVPPAASAAKQAELAMTMLSPASRVNVKPKGAQFKTEFVRAEGKDAREAVDFHNMTWCVVNKNEYLRLADEQMENLIEKGLIYLLKVDGILRGVLCTYRLKTDENLSGIEGVPLWDRMKNAEIKDTDPNAVLFWAIGTGYWMEDAPKGLNLGETFIKKAKEFFETDEDERKKTKYVATFSPAGAKRKDKPKTTETIKRIAAIFIERTRGLFYGGLDRIAGFADMGEGGLDDFKKLLEKKGVGESMRRRYAIYLYLLCFRQGGYEDFFSDIYKNAKDGKGFVSLRNFFKAKLGERIADSVTNLHVGKGGASIAKVLPQKAGHTRPDAPYTAIYGYKGFEKDDTAFDDLQQVIERLVEHGKWPRGSGLISELVKEAERQLRKEGQISGESWSKDKIEEITSWFAPYKFEFPDKYLVEAIKACCMRQADPSLGVLTTTPEKMSDAEKVVSLVVDRCEDEVRVKIIGVDRGAADLEDTARMIIAYSQKSGRQVKIRFIGYDASAENLSHARRSFESLTRSLGEPWANRITYEFHYADFADERYRALIFPEDSQPSIEPASPATSSSRTLSQSEFVRASNLAPGSRFTKREKVICGLLGDSVCQEIIDSFARRGLSDAKLAYLGKRLSSLQGASWKIYDTLCFDPIVPMFLAELYRLLDYPDRAAEIIDQAIIHGYAEIYSNYAMNIPRHFYNTLVFPRNAREQKLLDAINRADPKFLKRFSDEFHAGASPEHILTQDVVSKFVYKRVVGDGAYWIGKGIFSPAVEAVILDHFPELEAALSGEARKARLAAVISLMGMAGVLRQEQDRSAVPGFNRILEWIDAELHGNGSVVIGQDDNGLNAYGKRVWNFLLPELMQPEAFTHRDDNASQRWRVNSCFGSYWGPYMESHIQWLVDTLSQQLHRNGTMNILDLMSGRFSYVPSHIKCHVLALGMNAEELAKNETADAAIVQDLMENPTLVLDSNSQDMVIVVSGIQYIDSREVLKEAKRVLRPGGMLLIIGAWNATITERQIQGWDGSVEFIAGLMKRAGFDDVFYYLGPVFQTESHPLWPYAIWSLKEPISSLGRFEALAVQAIRASNLAPGSRFNAKKAEAAMVTLKNGASVPRKEVCRIMRILIRIADESHLKGDHYAFRLSAATVFSEHVKGRRGFLMNEDCLTLIALGLMRVNRSISPIVEQVLQSTSFKKDERLSLQYGFTVFHWTSPIAGDNTFWTRIPRAASAKPILFTISESLRVSN